MVSVNNGVTAAISGLTLQHDYAENGGGIDNNGPLTVTNSTISGNSAINANSPSGGIDNQGQMDLTNSIIAANDALSGDLAGTPNTSSHTLIGGMPLLRPLSSNGGPTQTIPLLPGSPATGAGDPPGCAAAPVNGLDQRGFSRPAVSCDIGACQTGATLPAPTPTASPATASAVWVIGTSAQPGGYSVLQGTGGSWTPVDGAGVRIAVDPDGQPWVVNSAGAIYHHVNGAW